ncbi:DUF4194 domain-containing protein [Corynebacterium gottingense]|uniref:DUF4194 domain-containing protein n=1 Tax=Corynebacterium gottingense TaxID=2041036 RepID=A0ABX9UI54_9CORY|nr:DUF4194 domain-containing protein [Corynebacterium gottingense]RMD18528.1 DUF4194 domain-containing protein [Corynebacterium gottingense]WJZ14198.1 hypothetical protein CGOTT_11535 [Corynebacterium gottingense]WJZ16507.1 hypothetical protein CGOTTB_11455 [Corynebacterium gottingense]
MDNKLYDGDTGTLTGPQRRALAELIRGPYVSSIKTPEVFQTVSGSREVLAQQLDNLFLTLIVDDDAGVAYTKAWEVDVPDKRAMLRKTSLTFMDTVIVLHLRRELVSTSPTERTIVNEDEVFEATVPYQGKSATDKSNPRKQFTASWNKMKRNSIVIDTPTEGRYEVSPVLRIIFSGEEIAAITESFRTLLEQQP